MTQQSIPWAGGSGANLTTLANADGGALTVSNGLPTTFDVDRYIESGIFNRIVNLLWDTAMDVARNGILEWHTDQPYVQYARVIGSDGVIYKAQQANTGNDPTTDTSNTFWISETAIATNLEVQTGTDTSKSVTPSGLLSLFGSSVNDRWKGTESEFGLARLATSNQVDAATSSERVVTPASLRRNLLAPLASPALTGNPTAPTQASGNDSTRIATTAFVKDAVGAVSAGEISSGSVTTDKLANLAVTDAKLASNAVTTAKINGLAVTTAKIATKAITNTKIADDAVGTEHLNSQVQTRIAPASGGSTGQFLQKTSSGTTWANATVADGAITAAKLASNAVTSVKIANSAVTNAKILNGTIAGTKLISGTIGTSNLGSNVVTEAKLASASVTSTRIAGGAVTEDKLSSGALARMAPSSGGSTGQYLRKTATGTEWETVSGGGGGLNANEVDARIADWAETGDTSAIPADKLINAPGGQSGGLSANDVDARIADWAQTGDTSDIPADKLDNAPGLTQMEVDARIESWAQEGDTSAIPSSKLTNIEGLPSFPTEVGTYRLELEALETPSLQYTLQWVST